MSGTGQLGWCYLYGRGIEKCLVRATAFLTEGALGGSKSSCYNLGIRYANGSNGFPKDLKMARRYYSMVATASKVIRRVVPPLGRHGWLNTTRTHGSLNAVRRTPTDCRALALCIGERCPLPACCALS